MPTGTIASSLASYSYGFPNHNLDDQVKRSAKDRILDSLGCAVGALNDRSDPVERLLAFAAARSGSSGVEILGTGTTAPLEYASFTNSALIRYLDWNDEYGSWIEKYQNRTVGHPSGNIGPLLATANAFDWTGEEFLEAVVLAYEIHCGLADVTDFRADGFDHVNYGLIASSLAVGTYRGLTEAELQEAVEIAVCGNLSLGQARCGNLTEWKGFAFGNAIRNAVVAVELADSGIRGPNSVFEGESGLIRQLSFPFGIDTTELGHASNEYRIGDSHLKKYPVCFHLQDMVDTVLDLKEKHGIRIGDIQRIAIETNEQTLRTTADEGKWAPDTRDTADHSLPYCVSRALIAGRVTPDQFSTEALTSSETRDGIGKISTDLNEDEMVIKIETTSRTYDFSKPIPDSHTEISLSREDIMEKLSYCFTGQAADIDLEELARFVDALEERDSLEPLFRMVQTR